MHGAIVMDYIKSRMAELGHAQYSLRLRHFVIPPSGQGYDYIPGQLMVLVEPVEMISITSDSGFFDLATAKSNELQYEHTGMVTISNYAGNQTAHVRFVQAIPK
ncbi:hypothetical protein HGH93_12015 [Chitinophaga polysaccharea]|uniref:hypothetical protein n=1 Tax=Chitinophaga polysaccharea TaxID=1293035 RepID=UPI0014554B1E|nr:hypothetical protein [Chitinophaga polysaccharea]NLR58832.1 hypothetical protein [Chitinophaga polysaccharea]